MFPEMLLQMMLFLTKAFLPVIRMPAPFEAPLPLLVIDLDDGARVMLQGTGRGDDVAIGSRVRLVLRRYGFERGVPVYGYKARVVGPAV